jgi:hypothetical protein
VTTPKKQSRKASTHPGRRRPRAAIEAENQELRSEAHRSRAEAFRQRAQLERAKRAHRENPKNPRAVVRALKLTKGDSGKGRRYDGEELKRIYLSFIEETAGPPIYGISRVRWDLIFTALADSHERVAATAPDCGCGHVPTPSIALPIGEVESDFFRPDCPTPMTPVDALRNVARYSGQTESALYDFLRRRGVSRDRLPSPRPR